MFNVIFLIFNVVRQYSINFISIDVQIVVQIDI